MNRTLSCQPRMRTNQLQLSISRANQLLGWKPTVLLATGANSSNNHIIGGIVHFRIGRVPLTYNVKSTTYLQCFCGQIQVDDAIVCPLYEVYEALRQQSCKDGTRCRVTKGDLAMESAQINVWEQKPAFGKGRRIPSVWLLEKNGVKRHSMLMT
jgi:hypothetical protein